MFEILLYCLPKCLINVWDPTRVPVGSRNWQWSLVFPVMQSSLFTRNIQSPVSLSMLESNSSRQLLCSVYRACLSSQDSVPKMVLLAFSQGHIPVLPGCVCLAVYFVSVSLLSLDRSVYVVSVWSTCPVTPEQYSVTTFPPESLEFPRVHRVLHQLRGFWNKGRIFCAEFYRTSTNTDHLYT